MLATVTAEESADAVNVLTTFHKSTQAFKFGSIFSSSGVAGEKKP